MQNHEIRIVDETEAASARYKVHFADAVILTKDRKLLLNRKPLYWRSNPGSLCLFGGLVEEGETAIVGLVRELREELGAEVDPQEVWCIGSITEAWTQHTEIVHVFFWHDKQGDITGCYEGASEEFDHIADVVTEGKLMDYAAWALTKARSKGFII